MLSLLSTPAVSQVWDRSVDAFLSPHTEGVGTTPDMTLIHLVQREYRHRQVEQMQRAEAAAPNAPTLDPYGIIPTGLDSVGGLLFHPYQPLVIACDTRRTIASIDWERRERRYTWSHENRPHTRVTSLVWINPTQVSLLGTATDSGEVRVWRNPHQRQPSLVNAWMGMRGVPTRRGCGMTMEWMQSQGWMLCGGASDVVSIWDVEREICVMDVPVDEGGTSGYGGAPPALTSIAVSTASPLFFTGGSDGTLRCFDLRAPPSTAFVIARQQSPIVRVLYSRGEGGEEGAVVCAARDGDVLRADLRFIVNREDRGMTTLTLSPAHIPLQGRTGSPSPSAASTAGSVCSQSSLHPSPMLFPSNPSPLSTGSSPPMIPSISSSPAPSTAPSPALHSSASPLHHLTAFPASGGAITSFAVHPAFGVYAAVSSTRHLRVFTDTATLVSVKGGGVGGTAVASKSSPTGNRRQSRQPLKDGGRGGSAGEGRDVGEAIAWHPSLLMIGAAVGGGGDISMYGPAGSGGGGGSSGSPGGGVKESVARSGFSSSFIS